MTIKFIEMLFARRLGNADAVRKRWRDMVRWQAEL
jgi:hypothetical protein